MLALVFEVAGERYALRANDIVEVARRPTTRAVPGAPVWVDGLWARGESWVPVIDLSRLIAGTPCRAGAATRVAVVTRTGGSDDDVRVRELALLAEGMTRVLDLQAPSAEGVHLPGRELLGPIIMFDDYGVQLVETARVIPREVDVMLFGAMRALDAKGAEPASAAAIEATRSGS